MSLDITWRMARRDAEDAKAFCALSNSLYSRKVAPDYYHWQFFDCPHAPFLMSGWCLGTMVAGYGVHVVAGPGVPRAMSLDIMIAADLQGRGLIKPLADAALDEARRRGAQLMTVVGNQRAARALERWLGWSALQVVRDWTASTAVETKFQLHELGATPSSLATSSTGFYPRDARTLAWRTDASPRYKYQWMEVGDGRRCLGHCVVKVFVDPITNDGFGDIVGLFCDKGDDEACLGAVLNWLAQQGIGTASFYPEGAAHRDAAKAFGFGPSQRARFFCGDADLSAFELGMLDIDIY